MVIVGAGAGGLAAAIDLGRQGLAVTLLDRAASPGGKIRTQNGVDCGPTVLTMRHVLDQLFDDAGAHLDDALRLTRAELLARHAWSGDERLDLFADEARSADAIAQFAGRAEAEGFRAFRARAGRIFRTLEQSFIEAAQPSVGGLVRRQGLRDIWGISPFSTLWRALGAHFNDPRLRQLFGRYATYSGSSPFAAPATLMLIAFVEQTGVWLVEGGMARLAEALAALATAQGVRVRGEAEVSEVIVDGRVRGVRLVSGEVIEADAVILGADVAALAAGAFGASASRAAPADLGARSLSAVTWTMRARATGFPLSHHNVFFSADYRDEFDALFRRGAVPQEATAYLCAQDRDGDVSAAVPVDAPEKLLLLINAPATGDRHAFPPEELRACLTRTTTLLRRCGLTLEPEAEPVATSPADFNRAFPHSGGALYGRAMHGAMAAFSRPTARTRIPGLYLAGGGVHPGPGVPMAILSGRLAASALMADQTSR